MTLRRVQGWLTWAFLVVAATACATPTLKQHQIDPRLSALEAQRQRELVIRRKVDHLARLNRVAFHVSKGAVPFCGDDLRSSLGFIALNSHDFPAAWQSAAASALEVGNRPRVVSVVPGSPAATAGLQEGDVIQAVGDRPLSYEKPAGAVLSAAIAGNRPHGGPIALAVSRQNASLRLQLREITTCGYAVRLVDGPGVNAYADGGSVFITQGMMRFVENDEELALIIAHEVSHNALGHVDAKRRNALLGGFVGLIFDVLAAAGGVSTGGGFSDLGSQAGAGAYSQSFESEADYLSLYAMTLAGYDISLTPDFWRRMASVDPKAIDYASSHPTTVERALALDLVVEEIERKRALGLPLRPDKAK